MIAALVAALALSGGPSTRLPRGLHRAALVCMAAPGAGTRLSQGPRRAALARMAAPNACTPLKLVVAACLVADDTRVLIAQRPHGKSLAGMWEFPGGKVEAGETGEQALAREIGEELGIVVRPVDLRPLAFSTAVDEMVLLLFSCRTWTGVPAGLEGQDIRWVVTSDLRDGSLEMPPADLPLIEPVSRFVREEFQARWDRF
ncbi:NUDIX hydrolase domain-like protein [Pavlovales sp. CCMP2436]|nr:NUDIX hydrolase domain-like protein [Pavlovales sp. CCMP2436]